MRKLLLGTALASAIGMSGSSLLAQSGNISYIENNVASGTTGVSITSDPVITAILSQAGVTDGKTYSSWSFLVNDGTGSMDVFGALPSGYTPAVGDAISVTGKYSPYNQIPELTTNAPFSISQVSSGNTVPAIGVNTVQNLNVDTLPLSIAGYEWTVDNATLGSFTTFGTANQTGTITDSTGSMTMYYWESSYSMALQNLDGMTPQAGQLYDVTGFMDVYNSSSPEFIPISIVAVPEPTTLALAGLGGLSLLFFRRRSA